MILFATNKIKKQHRGKVSMEGQHPSSKNIRAKRLHIAEKIIAFENATENHHKIASSLSVPRTTLYEWHSRKESIPLAPEIITFF